MLFSFPSSEFPATTLLHSQLHPIFSTPASSKGCSLILSLILHFPDWSHAIIPCHSPLWPIHGTAQSTRLSTIFEVLLVLSMFRVRILIFVSLQSFVNLLSGQNWGLLTLISLQAFQTVAILMRLSAGS